VYACTVAYIVAFGVSDDDDDDDVMHRHTY